MEKREPTLADLLTIRDSIEDAIELDNKTNVSGLIERLNATYTFASALSAYLAKIDRLIQRVCEADQKSHPGRIYTFAMDEYTYNYATKSLQKLEKAVTVYAASVSASVDNHS